MDGLRRVVRVLSASARDTHGGGVSGARLFVLRQIAAEPGLSIGALAARTLSRQSAASEVVARLAAQGLVARARSDADGRQAVLTLTAKGRRAIARVEPTAQERLARGLGELPPARRRALAGALEEWLAAAGLDEVPATMFFEERRSRRARGSSLARRSRSGR